VFSSELEDVLFRSDAAPQKKKIGGEAWSWPAAIARREAVTSPAVSLLALLLCLRRLRHSAGVDEHDCVQKDNDGEAEAHGDDGGFGCEGWGGGVAHEPPPPGRPLRRGRSEAANDGAEILRPCSFCKRTKQLVYYIRGHS
jgi:hypothetical protein